MNKRVLIAFITIFLATLSVRAEGDVASYSESGIIGLISERINKDEKQSEKLEKWSRYCRVNGFIQGMYAWSDNQTSNTTTGSSSFSVHRARFIVSGNLLQNKKGRKLDYLFYGDMVFLPKSPILSTQISYHHSNAFNVVIGQMQNPIHFEEQFRPTKFEFIDFSYAACYLGKLGGNDLTTKDVPLREMGIRLHGGFFQRDGYCLLNYNIGVFNHPGILLMNTNKSADFFCRLFVMPTRNLVIAAHCQWGEDDFSKVLLNNPDTYASYRWNGSPEYLMLHRWGGGVTYVTDTVFMRSEYIAGWTGHLSSEACYIEGGYKYHLPKQLGFAWAGAMVDYFCRDTFDYVKRDTKNAAIDMRYTLSFGWEPSALYRIQLAYSLEQRLHYTFPNNRPFSNSLKLLATASF